MSTGTVEFHRVLRTSADKVYRAFTEADAYARWLPPDGFTATVEHFDPRVGGGYRMSFRNFTTGASHAFDGVYEALIPGQRVCYRSRFDDPGMPGEMTTDVRLTPVSVGVEVRIVQSGIPSVIATEACHLGWQESLGALARLVEPDIQG